jgi:hypothetical protein
VCAGDRGDHRQPGALTFADGFAHTDSAADSTVTGAANPNFFFYVAKAPPPQTCTITATDNAGHSVNLFFQLTTGSITVQRRMHQ